jgi:hypothetical protein
MENPEVRKVMQKELLLEEGRCLHRWLESSVDRISASRTTTFPFRRRDDVDDLIAAF